MTVAELIKILSTYNPNAIVMLADWNERYRQPCTCDEVSGDDNEVILDSISPVYAGG